jgi:hypothetical protein
VRSINIDKLVLLIGQINAIKISLLLHSNIERSKNRFLGGSVNIEVQKETKNITWERKNFLKETEHPFKPKPKS